MSFPVGYTKRIVEESKLNVDREIHSHWSHKEDDCKETGLQHCSMFEKKNGDCHVEAAFS